MDRKNKFLLFILALMILSTLAFAAAAADEKETGAIGAALKPFGKLEQVYAKFGTIIDMFIYLIIFLGLTQVSLGKLWEQRKGGKAVVTGVAIVLSLGLALFERQANFNIMSFGPIAAIILIALMGYALWVAMKEMEITDDKLTMAAIAFVVVYFALQAVTPNVMGWLTDNVPIVGALLALLALGFTVLLIYKIVLFIIGMFGEKKKADERGIAGLDEDLKPGESAAPKGEDKGKYVTSHLIKTQDVLDEIKEKSDEDIPADDLKDYTSAMKSLIKEALDMIRHARREARIVARGKKYDESARANFKKVWTDLEVVEKKLKHFYDHIGEMHIDIVKAESHRIKTETAPVLQKAIGLMK